MVAGVRDYWYGDLEQMHVWKPDFSKEKASPQPSLFSAACDLAVEKCVKQVKQCG